MESYQALAGVAHATREGDLVTLYSSDVPQTMAALLSQETGGSQALQGLSVRSATLEDVFLKLTGRALRD
jgi:ABC-2 type transport system ATP-binding protein